MGLALPAPEDPAQILLTAPSALASQASTIATTQAADALIGHLSVTNGGQATYALPLQVPIGINGLVPDLQLSYQSVRSNGIVGVGWQISGFSSIGRCIRTTGQDDSAGPISDSPDDRFCLDGQRLVAIQGTYGADGTEYRTEIESFTRIFSRGDPGTGPNYAGPTSFEVWTPDGRITQYGTRGSSTEVKDGVRRTWGISQVRDRFRNTIEFTYTTRICDTPQGPGPVPCFGTGLVPKEILYGAHLAGANTDLAVESDRKVRFVYSKDRDDRNSGYERGLLRVLRHRLDSIEMVVAGATVWTYQLRYFLVDGMNRLVGAARCAGSPTPTCTPETKFTYSSAVQTKTRTPIPGDLIEGDFGNGPHSRETGRTVVLDVNGDGRDDVLTPRFSHVGPQNFRQYRYRILLGRAGSAPFTAIDTDIASGSNGGPNPIYPCFAQESVVDFNRDGKDDLIDLCMKAGVGWRVFLSTGSGFTIQSLPFL